MVKTASILRDLVAIPSVSSLSNVPVVNYALNFLQGWKIERHPYTDPAGTAKLNVVARTRPGIAGLALVCHTDTVPFDPDWKEAVNPKIRGGKLYGRGSCDVKGFLACVLSAASKIDPQELTTPLAVALTADEEIGCVGAKFLAKKKALRARHTIIGEPTGLAPVRAGKGYALAEIVVRGKEAHSAFPASGRSAIGDAARVILALERVSRKLASRRNRAFDPSYTTLNAGVIRGGSAKNIVPGECRITVEWRPIPGQDGGWAAELIREELAALREKDAGFAAELEVKRLDPAFAPSRDDALAGLLETLSGRRATTVAFGTEAAHLGTPGAETVVFGPGDMTVAHKSGEFVPIDELEECVTYLDAAIRNFCA
ncbi:MAG TPA: acetylornithine deacetylase [Bryobacteraceae bacterium]|jgi:acetylornithine deacetylase|nr:acetylornithine deacetylase [Bryobacteraceae bacterium]